MQPGCGGLRCKPEEILNADDAMTSLMFMHLSCFVKVISRYWSFLWVYTQAAATRRCFFWTIDAHIYYISECKE